MSLVATCGHVVNEQYWIVTVKETTISYSGEHDCLVTKVLCPDCYFDLNLSDSDSIESTELVT